MPLPSWLRCPACDSGSVEISTIEGPAVVLECRVCLTREAVELPPEEFSPRLPVS